MHPIRPNKIYVTLGIALSYVIGAQFGLLLVLSPDIPISLLWPPSGFALAAVLIWGRVALPGIFLGTQSTNLILLLDTPSWAGFGAGLAISAALTVEALAAGGLLKRFAASAPVWDSAEDLLRGSMIMGLVCAIPAVIGTGSLYASGHLLIDEVRSTMSIWWLGDFCGMIIFTPMAFAVARRTKGRFWRRLRPEVIPSPTILNSIIAVVALASFLALWTLEGTRISQALEREATVAANSLTSMLHTAGHDLDTVRALLYASDRVDTEEYLRYTIAEFGSREGFPLAQAVGWTPKVTSPPDWELNMFAAGDMKVKLTELDSTGRRVPVAERTEYFPVQFIHPFDSANRAMIGFDIASVKLRRKALDRARDTGKITMAAPIAMLQSGGQMSGMFFSSAIYRRAATLETVADRRANLTGFVSGVYFIGKVFEQALSKANADIDFHLLDESLPAGEQWYHTKVSPLTTGLEGTRDILTMADLIEGFNGTAQVNFAERKWLVVATPGRTYINSHRTWVPWGALVLLLVLGIGVASILIERISAQKRISGERLITEKALHDARAANESKSYFMAAASHDIKQPLYALGILTDTLLMTNPPEKTKPIVKSLSKSIKEMSRHFDTLMDVGRFQDGSFEATRSSASLSDLARRIDMEIGPLCSEKGLDWNLEVDDVLVHTDAELLLRLIRNLLINAVRYTDNGEVSFSAKEQGKHVYCKISDTGNGLSPDQQELVFSEIIRLRGNEIHASGHGLGLSIVKKVSAALDLELHLVTSQNKGTAFTFLLNTIS